MEAIAKMFFQGRTSAKFSASTAVTKGIMPISARRRRKDLSTREKEASVKFFVSNARPRDTTPTTALNQDLMMEATVGRNKTLSGRFSNIDSQSCHSTGRRVIQIVSTLPE